MHALVSTPKFLLFVELETGGVEVIETERPEYYGISWFPGSSDLVLSHSGVNNTELVDIATYATSEVGRLSLGDRDTEPFLSAPHQILCAPDGRVVVTNTGRNRVQAIEPEIPGRYHEVGLSLARWDRLTPTEPIGDHLNSVFIRDGLLYVVAHGFRAGSHLLRYRYPEMSRVAADRVPDVTGVHNVFVEDDGRIIGCHSETGGLTDLETGQALWRSGAPIYTRGLAASQDSLFVGESAITSRDNRVSCPAGIWILDRRTYETRDYIALGDYGAVHEVRLVDVPDAAHHGVPLAGGADAILRNPGAKPRLSDAGTAAAARAERLRVAEMSADASGRWSGFTAVLGFTETLEDGWKQAGEGLALLVTTAPATELALDYRLAENGPSHVSVVAGYDGGGGDRNMDAFLVQPSGGGASLSPWRHAGQRWALRPEPPITGLPREGTLRVAQSGNLASIHLGPRKIGEYSLQKPAPSRMGIRALNATFRPHE